MRDIVKKDIINILSEAIPIIKSKNIYLLRDLSDHVIHNAAIFQDEDSISVAVVVYALSKILKNGAEEYSKIISLLENANNQLSDDDKDGFRKTIRSLLDHIAKGTGKRHIYAGEVLKRAQIKKASKMYEHGISLAQVADTLGISRWELMDYIGKTTIPDSFENMDSIEEKIKFTREIFNIK